MKILAVSCNEHNQNNQISFSQEQISDLCNLLSQILLKETDKSLKQISLEKNNLISEYKQKVEILKESKEQLSQCLSSLSKEKTKSRIYKILKHLNKNNLLLGQKNRMSELLDSLDSKSFEKLKDLEEQLSAYL